MSEKGITNYAPFLALGILFGIVLALDKADRWSKRGPYQGQGSSDGKNTADWQQPKERPGIAQSLERLVKEQDRQGGKNNRRDNIKLALEALTLFAAVTYATITLCLLFAQYRANEISHDTYIAGMRPWVSAILAKLTSQIRFDKDDLIYRTTYKFENFGHSPAFRIDVDSIAVPVGDEAQHVAGRDKKKEACDRMHNDVGLTVFPGRVSDPLNLDRLIKNDDIAKAAKATRAIRAIGVFACVRYGFGTSWGYTSFDFVIIPKPPDTQIPISGDGAVDAEVSPLVDVETY